MSADWKAGMRAICIEDVRGVDSGSGSPLPGYNPKKGELFIVSSVQIDRRDNICLHFMGVDSGCLYGYVHKHFRRVTPACDRSEREQTELHARPEFWRGRE